MEFNKIYLGDCRELIGHIPHGIAPIIVTDPPFNIGYSYNSYKDDMDENEYWHMIKALIDKCNGNAVVIHYPEALHRLSIELGTIPKRVLSWCYNSNTKRQHRDIAFYGIEPNMAQVVQPYKNPQDKRIAERIERGIAGGLILDPFAGSGTTCAVAKRLGYGYLGFEINPKWHKVACDRLNGITKKEAEMGLVQQSLFDF